MLSSLWEVNKVSADYSISPDSDLVPAGLEPGDSFHLIFVTSTRVTADSIDGTSDGIDNSVPEEWNQHVNTVADGSSLAEIPDIEWKAVLSCKDLGDAGDLGVRADVNAPVSANVYRLEAPADGGPDLLADKDDFYTSTHLLPIKWNENGVEQNTNGGSASGRQVWSGSASSGAIDARPVGNSLSHIGNYSVRMGNADAVNDNWLNTSDATRRGPTAQGRVYALSELITIQTPPKGSVFVIE